MKCPYCNGSGWDDENMIKCTHCDNGEVEQTNEEWLRSATTEELAEIVYNLVWCSNELWERMECSGIDTKENDLKIVMEWLKEKHEDANT